jgi:hypothetical protein
MSNKKLYIVPYFKQDRILYLFLADDKKTFMGRNKIKDHSEGVQKLNEHLDNNIHYIEIPIGDKVFNDILELNYTRDVHDKRISLFLRNYNLEEWSI